MTNMATYIATLGPVGYFPASGTVASVLTLFIVYSLQGLVLSTQCLLITVIIILATAIVARSCSSFAPYNNDPSCIVLDELVGCLITFIGIPLTGMSLCIGLSLFRFFDIVKPLGIALLQRIDGAWGIMLDDIAAGLISCLLLHCIMGVLYA